MRQWVLGGNTRAEGKIVGVFEPETEIIRQGKASKRNEFGKLVKIQEAENQIVTHYEVYDQRPSDSELLTPSIEKHMQQFGHAPRLAAADTGVFSGANEAQAKQLGVKWVAVPSPPRAPNASKRRKSAGSRRRKPQAPVARAASVF